MFGSVSHRLFILPTLLLAGFVGLFAVFEFRKLSDDFRVRAVINDPVPALAMKLEEAAWELDPVIDILKDTSERTKASNFVKLGDTVKDLSRKRDALASYFLQDPAIAEGHFREVETLQKITDDIDRIKGVISDKSNFSDEEIDFLQARMTSIVAKSQNINFTVLETHQKEALKLVDQISAAEKQRALLAVFVLVSGLFLVLVLLDALSHYKDNAERAHAAEKFNAIFRAALQSTRVGVLIRDMRNERRPVVFINDSFTRLTGYSFNDVATGSSEFLFGWRTDPMAVLAFRRAVSLYETATLDILLYRKDGAPFWSEWHLSPVFDDKNNLTYFVSLFTDTTIFRQTQEDLIQAKQMAEHASAIKTNFLAMMSHEIRTPINGILGVLKLLAETSLEGEQKHLLGIAQTSSQALHGIINDILDYAKMEASKIEIVPEPFRLKQLIEEVVALALPLKNSSDVEVQADIQGELSDRLVGDVGRLRQILLNLVSNALKFTERGFVRIRVQMLMPQEVNGKPGYMLRFEVQDTGIGISPADQDKLFKEFSQVERSFTRKFGGTGLGLAICRRLVTLMDGEIAVESQPGKGSKFWFLIPLQIASDQTEADGGVEVSLQKQIPEEERGQHKILIVEDNQTNRLVASRYLEKAGFHAEEAVDGRQAIEMAKAKDYDLILMDVSMPEMDGMQATCHIRALGGCNSEVPIIALTAHVMSGDRELCLAAGMNDYLNKPLDYNMLVQTLERWLRVRSLGAPPEVLHVSEPSTPAETTAFSDEPDFDKQILRRMRDDLGEEVVLQVTDVFLRDSKEKVAFFKNSPLDVLQDVAHSLKGASGNCGLKRFSRLMAAIEAAAGRKDVRALSALLPCVDLAYTTACSRLLAERTNLGA